MTVYRVDLPGSGATVAPPSKQRSRDTAAWVLVLEGLVPSVRDQLAMSELLLFESPGAAAVINRTFVADEYVPEYKPKVRVRVPFVDVEVDVDDERGVDVNVGPMVVRTGGGYRAADDPTLLDEYLAAIRADADLQNAPLHAHVLGGVLTIEGTLNVADKLRAVALAIELRGVRGVVDRTETVASQPPYYRESDLGAYLDHRLGEHTGARKVELIPGANNRLKLIATVPTDFHAALALAVIASDPAVSELPVEPAFRDATSGAILTLRR